jgi:hypothetical protein
MALSLGKNNDYGVGLIDDASGNIYVVGTCENIITSNYDVITLKYNSSGILQWAKTFNSTHNKNDIGTALKIDAIGNIYVCASSEATTTSYDFLLLKYTNNGNLLWNNSYDYASLVEVPIGVDIDKTGNVFVTGASASALTKWDYTIAKYSPTGVYIGDVRNTIPGSGFDQPSAFKKDASGNIYVTGRSSIDGVNYDIKTIKLDANYTLQWTKTIDFAGKEDVANTIDIDANGNVFIGGYITKANGRKKMIAIKYSSSGNEIWRHLQESKNPTGDATIKAITVDANGDIYIAGEEKGDNNTIDAVIAKIETNTGKVDWSKRLDNNSFDEKATSINVANDASVYITVLKNDSTNNYQTAKYTELKTDKNIVYNKDGTPAFKANELIVKFLPSALKKNAIDDKINSKKAEFGKLDYFLKPQAMATIDSLLVSLCSGTFVTTQNSVANLCNITAIKVFKQLKTTDNTTISRLGETIKIPDFWTTLLLTFPVGTDIQQVYNKLNTIPTVVAYSEPNFIAKPLSITNDPEYTVNQASLHPTANYPNAHINVEKAWDIIPSGGVSTIKGGIFDGGVYWNHEDFGYDFIDPATSKIAGGWNFETNQASKLGLTEDSDGHGTGCASIIGAVRNNNTGVAGIAGGNAITGNTGVTDKGVALYDMHILYTGVTLSTVNYIYDAIVTSVIDDPSKNYAFGLHFMNHSWGIDPTTTWYTDTNRLLLSRAIHFANKAKVTVCASRGNTGQDILNYPAVIDEDWVLNVGGTGINGLYIDGNNGSPAASYGHGVDIAAPACEELVAVRSNNGGSYRNFNGTSSASPHVAGTVGLMMSYINTVAPSYQNLAPEDCERIIELGGQADLNNIVTTPYVGFGLLNAGRSMNLIDKTWNKVNHFGTTTNAQKTIVPGALMQTLQLTENYQNDAGKWFKGGVQYKVNVHRVNATVNHTLPTNHNIVKSWTRPSSSTTFAYISNNTITPRERVTISSMTNTQCTMSGYVYEVFDMSGSPLGWWPYNVNSKSNSNFEYTILSRNANAPQALIENKYITQQISLSPNPTSNNQTLNIHATQLANISINIIDMLGKNIKQIFVGKLQVGENLFDSDLNQLPQGVYIYQVKIEENTSYLKCVKE